MEVGIILGWKVIDAPASLEPHVIRNIYNSMPSMILIIYEISQEKKRKEKEKEQAAMLYSNAHDDEAL